MRPSASGLSAFERLAERLEPRHARKFLIEIMPRRRISDAPADQLEAVDRAIGAGEADAISSATRAPGRCETADALRPRHHIEIEKIVAVRRPDGMIAPRHQHDVPVRDCQSLVERAVVGIDALEGEALRRLQAVIVCLLEIRFVGQRVPVVLVRRIARPVAARRDDFDDQQALGLGVLGQDVADMRAFVPAPRVSVPTSLGGITRAFSLPARRRRA